jgi:hypothetical protein
MLMCEPRISRGRPLPRVPLARAGFAVSSLRVTIPGRRCAKLKNQPPNGGIERTPTTFGTSDFTITASDYLSDPQTFTDSVSLSITIAQGSSGGSGGGSSGGGVDARQVDQGGVLPRYERGDAVKEKVLQARPP